MRNADAVSLTQNLDWMDASSLKCRPSNLNHVRRIVITLRHVDMVGEGLDHVLALQPGYWHAIVDCAALSLPSFELWLTGMSISSTVCFSGEHPQEPQRTVAFTSGLR